jgi:hypothetical protein
MIPGVVVRVAGDTSGYPAQILIVPNVPMISARDTALVTKDETHVAEKLIGIEL